MKRFIFYTLFISLLFISGCSSKTADTTQPTTTTTSPTSVQVETPKKETTLRKIKQENGLIYYEGQITVSGKYTLYPIYPWTTEDYPHLNGQLCFYSDEETSNLIPREPQLNGDVVSEDLRAPWFCFSNKVDTTERGLLPAHTKCPVTSATIEISNYIVSPWEANSYDTAKLENVISKTWGKEC